MPKAIQLDTVALDIHANGIKQILRSFARCLSPCTQYDYNTLVTNLNALKSNDTAAIGGGIMVFHGWIDDWKAPTKSIIRLKQPLDIAHTPDRQAIDVVLLILSPRKDGPIHLRRLSNITRFIRQADIVEKVRGADNADAIKAIFANIERERRAA
jgi:PTS system nitrogen regulatory IIA component